MKELVHNFIVTAPLELPGYFDLQIQTDDGATSRTYTVPRKLALMLKLDLQRLIAAEPDGEA